MRFDLVREIRKVDPNAVVWFLTAFEVYSDEFKTIFPYTDVKKFVRKPISVSESSEFIFGKNWL